MLSPLCVHERRAEPGQSSKRSMALGPDKALDGPALPAMLKLSCPKTNFINPRSHGCFKSNDVGFVSTAAALTISSNSWPINGHGIGSTTCCSIGKSGGSGGKTACLYSSFQHQNRIQTHQHPLQLKSTSYPAPKSTGQTPLAMSAVIKTGHTTPSLSQRLQE